MPDEQSSNTGHNKKPGTFSKGDPRINRKGRPRTFDALRELAQQIAHEVAKLPKEKGSLPIIIDGHKVTVAEMIMRQWAQSGKPELQRGFMEIAFGKVPTPVEIRDWREAARRDGMNPDEVENEIERIIAAKMVGRSDSGCMAEGGTGEAVGEGDAAHVDTSPIADTAAG